MTFTREQKKEAYKKLSPEMQDFVMDNETTEIIGNFLTEAGLNEEQSNDADLEILLAMYGLQTLSDAINNIAKLCGKNAENFSELKSNLERNIFDNITKIKNGATPVYTNTEPKKETVSGVGQSFEQIILNQARAMQPARPAGYVPQNLPTNEPKPTENVTENIPIKQEEEHAIHNYVPGADPYREPIE
jgi:hypothetical protein